MERRLRKDRLASQHGFAQMLGDLNSPLVVGVVAVCEGHQKAGVRNRLHGRVKPLRADRSFGPRIAPARRMYGWLESPALALSRWSRTIFPCGTPVFDAMRESQSASSLVRRIVIV